MVKRLGAAEYLSRKRRDGSGASFLCLSFYVDRYLDTFGGYPVHFRG